MEKKVVVSVDDLKRLVEYFFVINADVLDCFEEDDLLFDAVKRLKASVMEV
jgi:hypothetical protein